MFIFIILTINNSSQIKICHIYITVFFTNLSSLNLEFYFKKYLVPLILGNVGRTFYDNKENFTTDPFSMGRSTRVTNIGLDHKDPAFQNSRWCFDTPGTVQPDQVSIAFTLVSVIN